MRFNPGENNVLQWRDEDKHFNLRSKMATDQPFGFMETHSDVYEHMKTTEESLPMFMEMTVFLSGILASEKDRPGFGKVMGIAKKVTAERFGPAKKAQRNRIAGSGTTATAIRATLLYMITNPRHPPLHDHQSAHAEARGLLYRRVVIKKGLHIFPPVAGTMAKEAPAERDTWNWRFIPGVTCIGWSA
ncbi:Trichothecene C-15 hydroxylase [Colletotrichum shisoi]|uniref:Trichothecene C-15 hydroxylase n=1 Tax=Colletotrichum shisoi TaxID=2078593 RepID=A0A5Q4CA25_9PEZI|nr:Trichothecene C-15 hydroxylase [Colletotrichum shisoi]